MLRYVSYNIVFQEIPGEVTLAVNLSNCPNGCKGCHSSHLQQNIGEIFDEHVVNYLLDKYSNSITCFCFMGGDADPEKVENLSKFVLKKLEGKIKIGWYSGKNKLPKKISVTNFNYIKLGPYIEKFGGLDKPETNQRFYKVDNGEIIDQTYLFQQKNL